MIRRHSLVWLKSSEATTRHSAARQWQNAAHPFMVCRTRPGEELSLGFCPPPLENREFSPKRVAVSAALDEIERVSRPPDLREIPDILPPAGSDSLKSVPAGCHVRLIGSRLWEVLIGERYTRSTSDLDVVVDLKDASLADAAAEFLASIAHHFPMPLDGELSFPEAGEVSWKEWLSGSPQVLLKAVGRVALIDRAELMSIDAPSLPRT